MGLRYQLRLYKKRHKKVVVLMNFEMAFDEIMSWEGDYSMDSNDPGGETKYGISKRAYPNLDIKNLSKEQAKEIYKMDYWDKVNASSLPESVRLMVFDCAVNQGAPFSRIILQKSLGVVKDGIIGPKTLKAFERVPESLVISKMAKYRLDRYSALPHWNVYGKGWTRRLLDISLKCAFLAQVELSKSWDLTKK